MSLENSTTGEKPSFYANGEGRWEEIPQQSASPQRSSGVSVGGMSGSGIRLSWETCGSESRDSTSGTSGQDHKARGAATGVGDLHSSDDLSDTITDGEPREGTCLKT
jgi:hypothetical protein